MDSGWAFLSGQVHSMGGPGPGRIEEGVMVGVGARTVPRLSSGGRGQRGGKDEVWSDSRWAFLSGQVHSTEGAAPGRSEEEVM